MSVDNSPELTPDVKKGEVDPPQSNSCRGSGESLPFIPVMAPAPDYNSLPSPSLSSISFEPRSFPPPSLSSVPVEYIIDQLRNLAPYYWNKPETADCTIIVPVPHNMGRPTHPSIAARFPPGTNPSVSGMYNHPGMSRRATQPALNLVPRISLKLHVDYLSAHSTYLRNLFSGVSPLDLSSSNSYATSGRFAIPANRLPRLMPGPTNHPRLLLPVPDPSSFHLLVHWMYFGETRFIEDCLYQGVIQWEGIARNVEYLGLSTEIKIFLGRWYRCWLHPERGGECFGEDDSDTAYSDEEGEFADDDSSTASDEDEGESMDDEKEMCRGRTRITRPLSFQDPNTSTDRSVLIVQPDS